MTRTRRSSTALALALALALCLGAQQLLYVLAGRLPQSDSQRPAAVRLQAAIRDRGMALRTLGLETSWESEPTEEELKKAYRQAVRTSHPDAPGGSAQKLQAVKEAYDFLLNTPTAVWDEGIPVNERRASTTYTSPGRKWPRYPQERPKAWDGPRREVIIGGVVLGTLVSIAIASQVVSTAPRDEYLASLKDMEGMEGLGGSNEKLPPLVKNGGYKLGEVYRQFADEAIGVSRPILLLGDLLPGGPAKQGLGTVERATALATYLLSALAAKKDNGKPMYDSITAVLTQDDLQAVARLFRINEDTANVREPDRVYLFFGGRAVLRFVRDEPMQEIVMVPAQKTFVDSSDFDPLAAKTLRENNSPGVFIFDLTREQWEQQSGKDQRPKILSDQDVQTILQLPPPEEPESAKAAAE